MRDLRRPGLFGRIQVLKHLIVVDLRETAIMMTDRDERFGGGQHDEFIDAAP